MRVKAALVRSGSDRFAFDTVEMEDPRPGEVLVKIHAVGMCHTDLRVKAQYAGEDPFVLGHEGAGVVEAVGADVTSVSEGDHVVLSYPSCGVCEACTTGKPYGCDDHLKYAFGGLRPDGTSPLKLGDGDLVKGKFFGQSSFASHSLTGERNLVKVDASLPLEALGPLGCGIQTGAGTVLNVLEPSEDQTFAVFGCGSVGLSAVMAAAVTGCRTIIGVDVHGGRLEMARKLGATHTVNASDDDPAAAILDVTDGGADFALDTTGHTEAATAAVASLRTFGTCAVVTGTQLRTGPGKQVVGVMQGASVPQTFIPRLIGLWQEGRFPFDKLIRYYDFEDIDRAEADSRSGETIKPVLRMG